jgi:hypothetical protein
MSLIDLIFLVNVIFGPVAIVGYSIDLYHHCLPIGHYYIIAALVFSSVGFLVGLLYWSFRIIDFIPKFKHKGV